MSPEFRQLTPVTLPRPASLQFSKWLSSTGGGR
jgi:hypothetical protein